MFFKEKGLMITIILMTLLLTACGGSIEKDIVGSWKVVSKEEVEAYWEFDEDKLVVSESSGDNQESVEYIVTEKEDDNFSLEIIDPSNEEKELLFEGYFENIDTIKPDEDSDGDVEFIRVDNITEELAERKAEKAKEEDAKEKEKQEAAEEKEKEAKAEAEREEKALSYYNELIETYRTAINEEWNSSKLYEEDLGPSYYRDIPDDAGSPFPDNFGYELKDINGNGLPELVLGSYLEDGEAYIDEIYSLDNKEPVKLFESDIRINLGIYKDGTIVETGVTSPGLGTTATIYYKLADDGTKQWVEGYEGQIGENPSYTILTDPNADSNESTNEENVDKIREKYKETDIIEHSFTPFASDEVSEEKDKEDTDEKSAKNEEEQNLSDDEIEEIVADNLGKIEPTLSDGTIVGIFNTYYDMEDESTIWKSGVDPNHSFYQEAYDTYYPALEGSVAKEGMASIIKEMLFISLVPTNPSWTFGPSYELEVLSQDSENFKVKQSKAIGEQDSEGIADYIIHDLEYVKEDGKWKFAGAENISKNNYPL